mmetsp:Transcript_117213/g.250474  ORF Transcript_117213/g.250474 Transcript_117213/m.250474 type:complete len:400 (-) Transcript_117213:126-1325(-)
MPSAYEQAGKTFRERDRRILQDTDHHRKEGHRRTQRKALEAIDRFETEKPQLKLYDRPTLTQTAWTSMNYDASRNRRRSLMPSGTGTSTGRRESKVTMAAPPTPPVEVGGAEQRAALKLSFRPPSPLGVYDYGKLSTRSVSLLAAQRHPQRGVPTGGGARGETTPSAPLGGYPWSMQEPILMQPRSPSQPSIPLDGVIDLPPLKRSLSYQSLVGKLFVKPPVRSTRGQTIRAEALANGFANQAMNQQLDDQASWDGQHGYGWKDRTDEHMQWLDQNGRETAMAWLKAPKETWSQPQDRAYRLLEMLYEDLLRRRWRVKDMFKFFDADHGGTFEPQSFLAGLCRMNIPGADQLTPHDLVVMFRSLNWNFNGSISLAEAQEVMARIGRARGGSGRKAAQRQ